MLMQPQQTILASWCTGFVCKLCLVKLRMNRWRHPCFHRSLPIRGIIRSKWTSSQELPRMDREVHFYDQTPDGNRVERFVDDDYEKYAQQESFEADLKKTMEENAPTLRKILKSSVPNEYQLMEGLDKFEKLGENFRALAEKLRLAGDPKILSTEDLEKMKYLLKNDILDGTGFNEFLSVKSPKDDDPEKENLASALNAALTEIASMQDPHPFQGRDFNTRNQSGDKNQEKDEHGQETKPASPRFSVKPFPKPYQEHITLLQDCIETFHQNDEKLLVMKGKTRKITKQMVRGHLARAYMLSRKGLLAAPESVPSNIWEDLWQILESNTKENINRLIYVRRLGDDIEEIGLSMSLSQRLLYVEALFLDGARKSAMNQWRQARPSRGDLIWDEYWEIGIRMLAKLGRIEEACKIAENYFENIRMPSRYRALLPLIKACLISKKEHSVQRAWALYLRLRINLGNEIMKSDYDILQLWFLDAGESELALAIFRDMMLMGDESAATHDSIAIQRVSGIIADFKGVKIQQSELEWEDTRALSVLPIKFKNKFFFGSWVKKLIGDDELTSAKKVLDLMQDHGILPSPMHMNGLIGAWFRRGTEDDFAKADDLAWRMIKKKLENTDIREFYHSLENPLRPNFNGYSISNKSGIIVPPATIETFSILTQQYRQRQKKESLSALFTAFVKSRIPPSTGYLNQIILVDTRDHKSSMAFETYRTLTARGVQPNFETFILMWNLMKRMVDPSLGRKVDKQSRNIGTCRNLFTEMIRWKSELMKKRKFPRELYDLIILSFSLKQDHVGTAVALRALQQEFGMFPDVNCIRVLVLQLARLGLRNKVGMKPRRLDIHMPMTKSRISNVTQLFHKIKDERGEFLRAHGIDPEKLSEKDRNEESIVVSVEVLRHVAIAQIAGENRVNFNCYKSAKGAAHQMGVPNCVVWEAPPVMEQKHESD